MERNDFQTSCMDKDVKIKSLMKTNLDLQAQISKLNQVLESKDNLEQQLEDKQRFIYEY